MKSKITVCAALALLFAPVVSNAMSWGTELNGALWTMDGKDFKKTVSSFKALVATSPGLTMTGKVTQGKLAGAVGVFVEGDAQLCLGAALGYGAMPAVSLKMRISDTSDPTFKYNEDLENKITYIPVDVYLKRTSTSGKLILFGGGGVNYVMASTDFKRETSGTGSGSPKGTFTQKKMIPHVQGGGEMFLSKRISVNFGFKYLFSAVLDNLTGKVGSSKVRMIMDDGAFSYKSTSSSLAADQRPFKYDLSGLRVNLGLRAYF